MSIEIWRSDFGDSYTERNQSTNGREQMFSKILGVLPDLPKSILEVGANRGLNLDVLNSLVNVRLIGLEPNEMARKQIAFESLDGSAQNIPLSDNSVDMIFTCGVFIHIPPDELKQAYDEIYRVASKYIVCIEYFSDQPREIPYRGKNGLLWKQDFGKLWMEYPLNLIDYRFYWKQVTGLDNVTCWIFQKAPIDSKTLHTGANHGS